MIEVKFIVSTVEELKQDVADMVAALGLQPKLEDSVVLQHSQPQQAQLPNSNPVPVAPTQPVQPMQQQVQQAPVSTVPLSQAPEYTIDQIAPACVGLIDAGKQPELMALLAQFGVQALTQLVPAQYGPFVTAIRGLGAQI